MQTTFPEPRFFICSRTIQAAKKLVAHYNRELAPLGITSQQMLALGVLWKNERISLGEFAQKAGIGKAAAVTMMQRLEAMGLVSRKPDTKDARRNTLSLTRKARRLAPTLIGVVCELERRLEEALGQQALRALVQGLEAIRTLELPERRNPQGGDKENATSDEKENG